MSLFEDENYEYRDTFFVFLDKANRPTADQIQTALSGLGSKYEVSDPKLKPDGQFECLTIKSPYDFSAMDIAYAEGDDVAGQIGEITDEFRTMTLIGEEQAKLLRLAAFDARFDVYHFEQVIADAGADEFIDPGGLFLVIQKLVDLCQGVGHDPQSKTLI